MLLLAAWLMGTVQAEEALSFRQQGTKATIRGGHFELTFDQSRGGELTGLRLHDGSQWNEVLADAGLTYPQVRFSDGTKDYCLRYDKGASLRRLDTYGDHIVLEARGVPTTAEGQASGWRVTLTYEIYPEGALFTRLVFELSEGEFPLHQASVAFEVSDTVRKSAKYRDIHSEDRQVVGNPNAFGTGRLAFGKNREPSFTNELEAICEEKRALTGTPAYVHTKGSGRFCWVLGDGDAKLAAPLRYTNRLALGLGAAAAGNPRKNTLVGQRIYYWLNIVGSPSAVVKKVRASGPRVTRDRAMTILKQFASVDLGDGADYWMPNDPRQIEACLAILQKGPRITLQDGIDFLNLVLDTHDWHPTNEQIDRIVAHHGTVLILFYNAFVQRGSNGYPHADYTVLRNRESLERTIAYAHRKGLRVGIYIRGIEPYFLNSGFFQKFLKRDWDGVYVDWHGPVQLSYHESLADAPHEGPRLAELHAGDLHYSTDGSVVPARAYFLFTRRLRETVGRGGFLLGHNHQWNSGIFCDLCFDACVPGEANTDGRMFAEDVDRVVFDGMLGGTACVPWVTRPEFRTREAVAKMAVCGLYPGVMLGYNLYSRYPRYAGNESLAFVAPYWRLLEKINVNRAAVFNSPAQNLVAVRSSHPDFHSLVYKQEGDKYLLIAANLGRQNAKAELAMDAKVLGMSGQYRVRRIEPQSGKMTDAGLSLGVLATSELKPWDLEGFLLERGLVVGQKTDTEPPIHIDNGVLRIGVDPKHGRLIELADLKTGFNEIAPQAVAGGLWELELFVEGQKRLLAAEQAKSCQVGLLPAGQNGLRLAWQDFPDAWAGGLRVEATVELDPSEPMSRWTIRLEKPADLSVSEVRFPQVTGLAKRQQERLAVPTWLGQEAANPRTLLYRGKDGKPLHLKWEYPGALAMQFVAWYAHEGPGFYAACDDTSAFRKSLFFWGTKGDEAHFAVVHYPENRATGQSQYALPYRVRLGTFRGDWITAAERYRAWGVQQPWARQSRLHRGLVAPWVLNTGIWVWNRGRSPGVLPPAAAFQEKLGLPVSVFWHWWHGCAYNVGFPEYFPPREGTEPFKEAVARAQRAGLHAIVYMHQRDWNTRTRSWQAENAERFAVKREDGALDTIAPNIFTRDPQAHMCMATPFWRNKYAGLAEDAFRDLHLDGIYMDVACHNVPCFDPTHGHPLGGGNYWMRGFEQMANDIRKRCAGDRPLVLAGEGCGETWLPYLDVMLTLEVSKERFFSVGHPWEPIPLFPAVYHRYAVCYGSYSSLTAPPYDELWPAEFAPKEPLALLDRKFARQFYLEQARVLVWGQQPTIANFLPRLLEDRPEETAYLMRLARVRNRALKYLLYGEFLRPPAIDAPEVTSEFSRLSIYAGQKDRVTTFTKRHPLALAGAWRATDGGMAVAVVNIADEPLRLPLRFDPDYHGLKAGQPIWRIAETGRQPLGRWQTGQTTLTVTLPPRDVWVIEFPPTPRKGLTNE